MDDALTTEDVLIAEFQAIWPNHPVPKSETEYFSAVHQVDQAALCLSGGGIRSASFSLGVVQALAQKGLLSKFHYLSTVSGGGYIGAWLQRWIHERGGDAEMVCASIAGDASKPAPTLPEIEALRERSNFITPRASYSSVDFWTAVVIAIRNILLNWLIFFPALLATALVPIIYFSLINSGGMCIRFRPNQTPVAIEFIRNFHACPIDVIVVLLYVVTILVAVVLATYRTRMSLPSNMDSGETLSGKQIIRSIVIPSIVFAFAVPLLINLNFEQSTLRWLLFGLIWISCFSALLASGLALHGRKVRYSETGLWVAVSALTSSLPILMAWLIHKYPDETSLLLLASIGPLIAMWSLTLQAMFYVGFRKNNFRGDVDREWLARLSAVRVSPVQAWLLLAGSCLLLPAAYSWLASKASYESLESVTAVIAALSGFVAVLGGRSAVVSVDPIAASRSRGLRLSLRFIISAATVIFAATLFALMAVLAQSWANDVSVALSTLAKTHNWLPLPLRSLLLSHLHATAIFHIGLFLVLFLFVRYVGRRINVNRFSLHGVYRNRLTRAFLGAARAGLVSASRDRFTGFDPMDNVRLHQLQPHGKSGQILFPVINVTMNLTRGDNLAWQERMASSFVLTPIACGSDSLTLPRQDSPGAYIKSTLYGGNEPDLGGADHGISLGTAMTISGAAASPSMGYNSTAATAFLMTLFNVRLGAWFANPALVRKGDYTRAGPSDALRPLLCEMFNQTNDRGRDVYLTDGGHFENLGLYEMVRRRCRFIVVIDAGADEHCAFEDLGNAVRKVSIDLNTDIHFSKVDVVSRKEAKDLVSSAIGRIYYPECNKDNAGWLLYLKPSYHRDTVPLDVRAYAEANSVFPHEPTVDQWFSESQFESYRRLGFFLMSKHGSSDLTYSDLASFFLDIAKSK